MENRINELILKELISARKQFPDFHSSHEGYAVIKEEIEETYEELVNLKSNFSALWSQIKQNNISYQKESIENMKTNILNLIKEAVQVAAMIEKFDQDVK